MTRTGANLVVHMDLPKTGTTFLQDHVRYCQAVWIRASRDQAASFRASSVCRSFFTPCARGPIAGARSGRTAAVPSPSLCLNIPKTGSSFTSRFFDAADWLELRRRCGLGRLAAPNRASVELVRRIKRYGPGWGNLTCRFWDHHAGYSSLPSDLRRHPKLCTLRDLRGWYCSFYLYIHDRDDRHVAVARHPAAGGRRRHGGVSSNET